MITGMTTMMLRTRMISTQPQTTRRETMRSLPGLSHGVGDEVGTLSMTVSENDIEIERARICGEEEVANR
jgi:hypothetical protein